MNFRETTLGEISGGGSYGLGTSSSTDSTGPKFLRTTDIVSGTIDWSIVPYCSADSPTIAKYKLFPEDIVISRTGANAGLNCLVLEPPENAIFAGYLVRFQINRDLADARYVSYVLRSIAWKEYVEVTRTGSAQPQFNAVLMSQFPIALPPLNIQKAISALLSAVDSKIAANNALSKTLEDIAQTIFKSWFIDFDPVKAKMAGEKPAGMDDSTAALFPDSMEDSELGIIPKGWTINVISDFGKVVTGKTPSTKVPEYWGEQIPFVTIPDMHGQMLITSTTRALSQEGADSQRSQNIPASSTMVTCIATPGLVGYATKNCQTNQQINSVIPNVEQSSIWLFWHLRGLIPTLIRNSGIGTVFANLNKSDFSSIKSITPEMALRDAFSRIAEPSMELLETLNIESQYLRDIRDALLPRLISGELQIPEEMLAS